MRLSTLVNYLDRELETSSFTHDFSNNGLQVEGRAQVRRAVFGVDGCAALFDYAIAAKADFIFVHHGLSWGAEPRRLIGMDARRFGQLFRHGISLYAAHLPLDAHPRIGNNAVLAKLAGIEARRPFLEWEGRAIGCCGELSLPLPGAELSALFADRLNCTPRLLGDGGREFKSAAVVSGRGGLEAVMEAVKLKADVLITGELEHTMYHPAMENGLAVLALGHYASETTGPRALMDEIDHQFDVECLFGDFPTGL